MLFFLQPLLSGNSKISNTKQDRTETVIRTQPGRRIICRTESMLRRLLKENNSMTVSRKKNRCTTHIILRFTGKIHRSMKTFTLCSTNETDSEKKILSGLLILPGTPVTARTFTGNHIQHKNFSPEFLISRITGIWSKFLSIIRHPTPETGRKLKPSPAFRGSAPAPFLRFATERRRHYNRGKAGKNHTSKF